MIRVNHLSKVYGEFVAVSDVSFSADKGEVVGFLGPNGAGKTTTIRMLSTYMPPTSGVAEVAGFDVVTQSEQVRRSIGYLPENPPLYGEMMVVEYLKFVATIKGVSSQRLPEALDRVLQQCGLADVRRKLCSHLSRGYRQRVGLAQAIIHDPAVVILDEPTSGLDPKQIIQIRELIGSLAEGRTVILSTHILPEVTMVCSKVVIINKGRTVLEEQLSSLPSGRSLEEIFIDCVTRTRADGPPVGDQAA
jgi:ABC-2 type transport system ATP-binding protein